MQKPEPEKNYPALREHVEAAYDQIADRYAALTSAMPARVVELGTRFLSHLPPTARVLDVGCGPGYHMAWMEAQRFHITGIDISNEMLTQARMRVRVDRRITWLLGTLGAFYSLALLRKESQHYLPKVDISFI